MTLGIVGHEREKFTIEAEHAARREIRRLIALHRATRVVSGKCHLGGIDIWAIQEADDLGLVTQEFPPRSRTWIDYRARNVQIAEAADVVYSLVVDKLPGHFTGPRFEYCYHCQTRDHVKSGGCWTAKYAREKLQKPGYTIVIAGYNG